MLDYIHIQHLHVTMYYDNNLEYYTNLSISTVTTILIAILSQYLVAIEYDSMRKMDIACKLQ